MSVVDLSHLVDKRFSRPDFPQYILPLSHDNFQKPKGYPNYYKLNGKWKIEEASVKFLKNGPLFSSDGKKVVVQPSVTDWRRLIYIVLRYFLLAVIGSVVGFFVHVLIGTITKM